MDKSSGGFSAYDKKIHSFGLISSIIIIAALLGVPLVIQIVSGVSPPLGSVLRVMGSAIVMFAPIAIIEFLSYTPILGAGGMYMSFITGNVMGMKLPAAQSGQKLSGVSPGSKQADVVSVLSIGVSSLVTTAIVLIGMLLASQLMPLLASETLAPAFANLMPAIYGALLVPYFKRDPILASVPCALVVIVTLVLGYSTVTQIQTFLLPVFLIVSVIWGRILFKLREKKKLASVPAEEGPVVEPGEEPPV